MGDHQRIPTVVFFSFFFFLTPVVVEPWWRLLWSANWSLAEPYFGTGTTRRLKTQDTFRERVLVKVTSASLLLFKRVEGVVLNIIEAFLGPATAFTSTPVCYIGDEYGREQLIILVFLSICTTCLLSC